MLPSYQGSTLVKKFQCILPTALPLQKDNQEPKQKQVKCQNKLSQEYFTSLQQQY